MIFYLNKKSDVTMFGCVHHEKGYWHQGRTLKNNLILFLNEGSFNLQIDDTVCNAKDGDVVLIPKDTFYKPLDISGCTYYFFHFDAEAADESVHCPQAVSMLANNCEGFSYFYNSASDYTAEIPMLFTPINQSAIRAILSHAANLDLLNDKYGKIRLDAYFKQFIAELEYEKVSRKKINPKLGNMLKFISDNIKKNISLSDISNEFNFSKSYIARLFKKELSISAGDYILKKKLDAACELIINTDISILEISEQLGFSSQYYFSNVFSKNMGDAPTVFRKKYCDS